MAQIYISLGTNVNRQENVENALNALTQLLGSLTLSSLFESEAVGFDGTPFYNMVIGAVTDVSLTDLSQALKTIEYDNGRRPQAKKFSPRTLDLDLLLYDDIIAQQPAQIPRDEITENAFVLWPLAEIASSLVHPVVGKSYGELWQQYDKSKQKLYVVPLVWSEK